MFLFVFLLWECFVVFILATLFELFVSLVYVFMIVFEFTEILVLVLIRALKYVYDT